MSTPHSTETPAQRKQANPPDGGAAAADAPAAATRRLTVPNVLSVLRLVGSLVLPFLAWAGMGDICGWLLVAMWISDWLDGKLARWLDQRSDLGARLDSIGDAVLYGAAVPSLWWLRPEFIQAEWPWIAATVATYAVAVTAGAIKFRTLPAYHTRAAKTCWLLGGIGLIVLFTGGPHWPALVAMAGGILTNLESLVITTVLPAARTDVGSLYHVLRSRKE